MRDRRALLPFLAVVAVVGVAILLRNVDIPRYEPPTAAPPPVTAAEPAVPDPHADLYAATRTAVAAWQAADVEGVAVADYPEPSGSAPQAPLAEMRVRVEADGMAAVDVALDDGTALTVVMVFDGRWLLADVAPAGA